MCLCFESSMQFWQMIFDLEKSQRLDMVQTKYNQKHGSPDLTSINGKQGFHRTRNRMKFGGKCLLAKFLFECQEDGRLPFTQIRRNELDEIEVLLYTVGTFFWGDSIPWLWNGIEKPCELLDLKDCYADLQSP